MVEFQILTILNNNKLRQEQLNEIIYLFEGYFNLNIINKDRLRFILQPIFKADYESNMSLMYEIRSLFRLFKSLKYCEFNNKWEVI